MKGFVLIGLDREEILRIAKMHLQIGGEFAKIAENIRKRLLIGGQDRVVGVHDKEAHCPVVHIDNDLRGITYIVQSIKGGQ